MGTQAERGGERQWARRSNGGPAWTRQRGRLAGDERSAGGARTTEKGVARTVEAEAVEESNGTATRRNDGRRRAMGNGSSSGYFFFYWRADYV